jgi:crossover junction endodeoxyribonuclease RuvC
MIILGIDPGTAATGFGIIEKSKVKSQKLKVIDYGCIKTSVNLSTAERLVVLNKELNSLLKKYKPDLAAVEDIFFFKNLKTAVKVSQARGAIPGGGSCGNWERLLPRLPPSAELHK